MSNVQSHPEPLMDVTELATYLKKKRSWVYTQSRLARKTFFPLVKVGQQLRFDRVKVLDWLGEQREKRSR